MYGNTALPSRTAVERVFSAGKNKLKPQTAWQTQRHGGAYRGRAPQTKIVPPPCEDRAPKKLRGSGLLECKLEFATVIFVLFVD